MTFLCLLIKPISFNVWETYITQSNFIELTNAHLLHSLVINISYSGWSAAIHTQPQSTPSGFFLWIGIFECCLDKRIPRKL